MTTCGTLPSAAGAGARSTAACDPVARFLQLASERPTTLAVRDGIHTLTYGELAERASILARRLGALDPDVARGVAIVAHRSCSMVVAVVAAALAGVRYQSLSGSMWKRDLVRAAADKIVLAEARFADTFGPDRTLIIDDDAGGDADDGQAVRAGQTAFSPPAVDTLGALQQALDALRAWDVPCARVAQVADFSAPECALEVWAALGQGGSLCILPDAHASTAARARALRAEAHAHGPMALLVPTSSLNELLAQDAGSLESASALFLLGAGLHWEHVRAVSAFAERNTVLLGLAASAAELVFVGRVDATAAPVAAVGRTIAGASITVVDERGLEVDDTSVGALWVRTQSSGLVSAGARGCAGSDGCWQVQLCAGAELPGAGYEDGAQQEGWTATQRRIAELWTESLDLDTVDLRSNFFSLGGDSLLAMRLVARVNGEFGLAIPWVQFLRNPTIADLAAVVDAASPAETDCLRPSARRDAARLLAEVDRLSSAQVETFLKEIG